MGGRSASVVGTAPTMSPQQTGLVNQSVDLAQRALSNFNLDLTQNPAYQSALSNVSSLAGPFDSQTASANFDENVAAPALENFERRTRPQAVATGLYGTGTRNSSALDLALAEAQRSLTTDLSRLKSQTLSEAYDKYLGRQLQGTALQAELSGMPMSALLPYIQASLAKPTEQPLIEPGRPGFGRLLLEGIAESAPKLAKAALGPTSV